MNPDDNSAKKGGDGDMAAEKKSYTTPRLTVHGRVEEITQQGGGNKIDLPQGTVVPDGATITDVTS